MSLHIPVRGKSWSDIHENISCDLFSVYMVGFQCFLGSSFSVSFCVAWPLQVMNMDMFLESENHYKPCKIHVVCCLRQVKFSEKR